MSITLGSAPAAEDVILDCDDHLYCGTRHGEIVRFFAPDYVKSEVFAHIGGFPLGLAFDKTGNLISCVGAMGLYSVSPQREVKRLTAETARSWTSIVDDARLRDPNDCDIAPDGRIYFTDSTKRYDAHDWALDSIENRATGRLLVYDPRDGSTKTLLDGYRYTNGVCMAHTERQNAQHRHGSDDSDEVVGVDEAWQADGSGNEQHHRDGKDNAFLIQAPEI
nr:SMP-30/gluconolactonase/LRE family protein [Mesorhizobium sp. 131-3-5]